VDNNLVKRGDSVSDTEEVWQSGSKGVHVEPSEEPRAKPEEYRASGRVAYSRERVYLVFLDRALEPASTLSILFKCQEHGIPAR